MRIPTWEKWNRSEPVPGELKCEGILHPHGRDSNTHWGQAASWELHVLTLWRKETIQGTQNCHELLKKNSISKQDSSKTTLQEQTPKTVLKNYVNCTTQGCQGTLYHPSRVCFVEFSPSIMKSECSDYDKTLSSLTMRCQVPSTVMIWEGQTARLSQIGLLSKQATPNGKEFQFWPTSKPIFLFAGETGAWSQAPIVWKTETKS